MMQDLRGRVMNFLDDPSLEAVKVGAFHAILFFESFFNVVMLRRMIETLSTD